jgi:15-cis-phytoene desaturase
MTGTPVAKLIITDNRIRSVEVSSGKNYPCDNVILAASLGPAQRIIRASSLETAFADMLALQSMPEVNLQIEFTRRAWPVDRTVFGVGTSLITFAEQSRTTFRHKPGRLSIILTPPKHIIGLKDEEIFEIFRQESTLLGIDASRVTGYRVVRHPDDFYLLGPGMNKLRPGTRTSIEGLFLAGDYVQQSLMATMEGAVIAGNNAAREVIAAGRSGD